MQLAGMRVSRFGAALGVGKAHSHLHCVRGARGSGRALAHSRVEVELRGVAAEEDVGQRDERLADGEGRERVPERRGQAAGGRAAPAGQPQRYIALASCS